jgi:hypothetical protein
MSTIQQLEAMARGESKLPFNRDKEFMECLHQLKGYTDKTIAKLEARIRTLEADKVMYSGALHSKAINAISECVSKRLAKEIDAARGPGLEYHGVWQEGEEYSVGSFVTLNGGIWFCLEKTTSRPGTGGAWQLACKAGRGS